MANLDIIEEKTISTMDGDIVAKITYNEFYNEFHLFIDGSFYDGSQDVEYLKTELNGL